VVRGHESHFVQLLQNLIGNAIKYRMQNAPRVHLSGSKENGVWRLAGLASHFSNYIQED
jgi:light-regulated signal transduction histidine kinase (bacteriophytochrome)